MIHVTLLMDVGFVIVCNANPGLQRTFVFDMRIKQVIQVDIHELQHMHILLGQQEMQVKNIDLGQSL